MKKSPVIFMVTIFLLGFVLVSCSKTPNYIDGKEYDKVAAITAPYAENILEGIETKDREIFITNFDAKMKEAMNKSQFDTLLETYSTLGTFKSCDLANIVDKDAYYGVNYKVTYTNKVMAMLVVIDKKEPNLVSGLWFK